jgi:general secretion pathway protein D
LDVRPKQIAIEVQIAEVTLDNSVSLGFAANFLQKPDSAVNRLTSANGSGTLADGGGFSYIWQNSVAGAGGTASVVKAALNTLQGKSQARTIAAPILVTLDNQKVSFTNGSQISVQTQSTSATTTTGNVNSFQYIDTGLTINVTPRVTGNNIFLEIEQQNSSPGEAKGDNPNPPITRNSQSTSVMVANGDTMLLGGLFLESGGLSSAGLPGISTVPVFGALFGNQKWRSARSEVVMLITPRILSTIEDTREVVDELRRKMGNIEQFLPAVGTLSLPSAAPIAGQQQPKGQQSDKAILPAGFNRSLRLGDEPVSVQQ